MVVLLYVLIKVDNHNWNLKICTTPFVGAVINRPRGERVRLRLHQGEMVRLYCRAIDNRPYSLKRFLRFVLQFIVCSSVIIKRKKGRVCTRPSYI